MFKRYISIVLVVVMVLSIFTIIPVSTSAEEVYHSAVGYTAYDSSVEFSLTEEETSLSKGEDELPIVVSSKNEPEDIGVGADIVYTSGNSIYSYTVNSDDTITITSYSGTETEVVIPNIIDGYVVSAIGYVAFCDCVGIKSITIPDSVKSISVRAFANCTGLKSITLPKNIESISMRAFENCTGLTEITIPKSLKSIPPSASYSYDSPFRGCSNMTTAVIEEGMETIPNYLFNGCESLQYITIPNSVTSVGGCAFCDCVGIKSITIPDSVKSISVRAFANCTGLKSITLPKNIESISMRAFENCTGLTEITIPKSLKSIPPSASYSYDSPFRGCSNMTTAVIEEGMETIPNYLFNGCADLQTVILPDSIKTIGENSFNGCHNLTVYCRKYSDTTINLIDLKVDCVSTNDIRQTESVVLNESKSCFIIKSGAKLGVSCSYSINDEIYNKASNYSVKIYIPEGASVDDGSLYVDKTLITDYKEGDNYITVPVSDNSGKITFNLEVEGNCKLRTYAILNYRLDGVNDYDIIDVINEDIPLVSLSAQDVVSTQKVLISGMAPVNSDVEIYVEDKKVAVLKSNKIGAYSGEISLIEPEDDVTYTIKAVTFDNNGKEIFAEKDIVYGYGLPVLTEFNMDYNGITYDLMTNNQSYINFRLEEHHGVTPFDFEVKFDNREEIDDVYISSTRNQVIKTVKAEWSETSQSFVFNGFFDENNHDYVPGKISVTYIPATEAVSYEKMKNIDYTSSKYVNSVSDPIKAVLNGKVKDCVEDLVDFDNQLSGVIKLVDIDTQLDFNILTDIIPSYLDPENAGEYGYEALKDDLGVTMYMKIAECCEDEVRGEIIDFAEGKITDFLIKGRYINEAEAIGKYFAFTEALGYAEKLVKWDHNNTDINALKHQIMTSGMSLQEQTLALEKLENATKLNNGTIAVMAVNILLAAAGIAIPFPASMILPLIAMNNSNYVDEILGKYSYLNASGVECRKICFNWTIDPSGYVFEAVTSNRVAGATATAYWIPFDDEIADCWEKPDESKAVIWDASEYNQVNPLITDNEGNYAWDVPEGLWKVVVEKDGYEIYETDWLPVPPPQTDVNIGLISTQAAVVENVELKDSTVEITFSQYITPETVSTVVIRDLFGMGVEYTLDYSKEEKSLDGTVYAKSFSLSFDEDTEISSVYIPDTVTNYNGKPVIAHEEIYSDIQGLVGDADGDGIINIFDATQIQLYLAKAIVPSQICMQLADSDKDGYINIFDATYIQLYLAKIYSSSMYVGQVY